MVDHDLCSSRVLSHIREESGDEELSLLPRHTKVVVTGNNRTKSVLVGLQGVVKKAVGLGGWHWLIPVRTHLEPYKCVYVVGDSCHTRRRVLKNGVEVKLQRNALSVLEHPTGNEDDFDYESSCNSDIDERDNDFSANSARFLHKLNEPRVQHKRPSIHSNSSKTSSNGYCREVHSINHAPYLKVNLAKLGTETLWRYCRRYSLMSGTVIRSREHMIDAVQRHFALQLKVDEVLVIKELLRGTKEKQES